MPLMETESAWSRALRDPALRDLPYKIETNEFGQLVMSPAKPLHGRIQSRIDGMLRGLAEDAGEPAIEFPIETKRGVKVPDVAWMSHEKWNRLPEGVEASPFAPEVCIEVLSESNTAAEMHEKRILYFESGASEVWICDTNGRVTFYVDDLERPRSRLIPSFPTAVSVKSTR